MRNLRKNIAMDVASLTYVKQFLIRPSSHSTRYSSLCILVSWVILWLDQLALLSHTHQPDTVYLSLGWFFDWTTWHCWATPTNLTLCSSLLGDSLTGPFGIAEHTHQPYTVLLSLGGFFDWATWHCWATPTNPTLCPSVLGDSLIGSLGIAEHTNQPDTVF